MDQAFELVVNGRQFHVHAESATPLLEILRDDLGLTGTKYGCGESACGACTVLLDGEPAHSCSVALGDLKGRRVTTIEGIEKNGRLHPVQQAFIDEGAMQCAYCVSGMVVAAVGHLQKIPHPTEDQITSFMSANICRCGCYPRMVAAIKKASVNA